MALKPISSSFDFEDEEFTPKRPFSPPEVDTVSTSPSFDFEIEEENFNLSSSHTNFQVSKTLNLNPQAEADLSRKSKETGQSLPLLRASRELVEVPQEIKDRVKLQEYFSKSASHATISGPDVGVFARINDLVRKAKESYSIGKQNVELGKLRTAQMFGDDSEETQQRVEALKSSRRIPFEEQGTLEKIVTASAEQLPLLLSSVVSGVKFGAGLAVPAAGGALALGALIPGPEEVLTVPVIAGKAFSTGFAAGTYQNIFQLEAGLAYDEFLDFRDENDKLLDPDIARAAAVGVGAINAGLEFVALETLLRTVPGAQRFISGLTTEPARFVLRNPAVRAGLLEVGKKFAGAIGTEAITEMAQEAVTIITGEFAKAVAERTEDTLFAEIDSPEAASRVLQAGTQAVYATIGLGIPGSVVGTVKVIHESNVSARFQENIAQVDAAVRESSTSELSPDHMEEFLGIVGLGDDVYMTADGVETLFQTDVEVANEILTSLGLDPDEARESARQGQDIVLPQSKIHARLPVEQFELIKQDLKPAPGAYSARDIQNNNAVEEMDRLADLFTEATRDQEGFQGELSRIGQQVVDTGHTQSFADSYTQTVERFANRMALEGRDRVEFLKGINVHVRSREESLRGRVFERGFLDDPFEISELEQEGVVFEGKKQTIEVPKESRDKAPWQMGIGEFLSFGTGAVIKNTSLRNLHLTPARSKGLGVLDVKAGLRYLERIEEITIKELPVEGHQVIKKAIDAFLRGDLKESSLQSEVALGLLHQEEQEKIHFQLVKDALNSGLPVPREVLEELDLLDSVTFEQEEKDPPRGSVTINSDGYNISLFENRNLSTLLHETDHIFFEEMQEIVGAVQVSEQLTNDLDTLRKWLGLSEGQAFEREHHEQFARGFEAYLLEGKAPTAELQGAFARFKRWLTQVYKSVKALDVKLNSDVRKVFDRLLAAETETRIVSQVNGITVKTQQELNDLGVVTEDQLFMRRLVATAQAKANDQLSKDRNRSYRENIKRWRTEATDDVDSRKIYQDINGIVETGGFSRDQYLFEYGTGQRERTTPLNKFDPEFDSLSRWVQLQNGFKTKGEFRGELQDKLSIKETGGRYLDNKRGLLPDAMRERAIEAGFIDDSVSTSDFIDLVESDVIAKKEGREAGRTFHPSKQDFSTVDFVEQIPAGDLEVGDRFNIQGIEHRVTGEDNNGDLIIENGGVFTADPFELFNIDNGLAGISKAAQEARKLPDRRLLRKNGRQITEVALEYGYTGADNLIDNLINTTPRKMAIQQLIDQMQIEHDRQFLAEDYLMGTKEFAEYLTILSKYLEGSKPGQKSSKTISRQRFKEFARKTIEGMSVRDAQRTDRFMSAMKKADNEERRATLFKDFGKAAQANERVRLNYEMAGESIRIRKEVESIRARTKRAGNSKTMNIAHRENIRQLAMRFNLADNMTPQRPLEVEPLSKLIAPDDDSFKSGFPASDFLLNPIAGPSDYRDLSVSQIREVGDLVNFLKEEGKGDAERTLTDSEVTIDEAVLEIAAETSTMKSKKVHERFSFIRRLTDHARSFFAQQDSLQFISIAIGAYQNIGPGGNKSQAESFVFDPMVKAQNDQDVLYKEVSDRIEPHIKTMNKAIRRMSKQFGQKMRIENAPVPQRLQEFGQFGWWTPDQIFAIALNQGNEDNMQRLFGGYPTLEQSTVDTLLDLLTDQDWGAVEGVWNTYKFLFPLIDGVHVRLNNFHMNQVEAIPVVDRTGKRRANGGYHPIRYDPKLSTKVGQFTESEDLLQRSEAIRQVPSSKSGFAKQRVKGVKLPLNLSLSPIMEHIRDTVHYISHAERIRDVDRIIRHEGFQEEVKRTLGVQVYDMMRPALRYIARPNRAVLEGPVEEFVEWTRGKTTAFILAYKSSVALKQGFSTFGAMHDMGPANWIRGFKSVLAHPSSYQQLINELSPYMANRAKSMDRELQSMFTSLDPRTKEVWFGDKSVTWKDVVNFGFWPIRIIDQITVAPIWKGSFDMEMTRTQGDVDASVNFADSMVRKSQPSAQPLDLSHWLSSGGVRRLFSMFQTFTVGKYGQRQRLHYRAWKQGAISTPQYAWFNFMDTILPAVAMNVLFAVIWGQDLEEPESQREIGEDVLRQIFLSGVPMAGELFSPYGSDIFDSPLSLGPNILKQSINDSKKYLDSWEDEELQQLLLHLGGFTSWMSGVPVSRIIQDYKKGEEQEQEIIPGIKFLIPAPKRKRK